MSNPPSTPPDAAIPPDAPAPPDASPASTPPAVASGRRRTSGWWYLAALGIVALGALVAGGMALLALNAAARGVTGETTIAPADTAVVDVRSPGEFVVFARYRTALNGLPIDEPRVVVLDPGGGAVRVQRADPAQRWSDGDGELVAIGDLDATVTGPHRVVVGPASTDLLVGVVVAPDPLVGVVNALGWATGVVALSVLGAIVVTVVVAVSRRRTRRGEPGDGGAEEVPA